VHNDEALRRHISETESGKRPWQDQGQKLAKALHIDPRLLLSVKSAKKTE